MYLDFCTKESVFVVILLSSSLKSEPMAIILSSICGVNFAGAGSLETHPEFRFDPNAFEIGSTYISAAFEERFERVSSNDCAFNPLIDANKNDIAMIFNNVFIFSALNY